MDDGGVPPPHRPRSRREEEMIPAGPRPPAPGHASPNAWRRTPDPDSLDEPTPFGLSWRALYVVVAGTLVVLVALFALFTRAFE